MAPPEVSDRQLSLGGRRLGHLVSSANTTDGDSVNYVGITGHRDVANVLLFLLLGREVPKDRDGLLRGKLMGN